MENHYSFISAINNAVAECKTCPNVESITRLGCVITKLVEKNSDSPMFYIAVKEFTLEHAKAKEYLQRIKTAKKLGEYGI